MHCGENLQGKDTHNQRQIKNISTTVLIPIHFKDNYNPRQYTLKIIIIKL